jgi:hypothetical protein
MMLSAVLLAVLPAIAPQAPNGPTEPAPIAVELRLAARL